LNGQARAAVADAEAAEDLRIAAIGLVGRNAGSRAEELPGLAALLVPQTPGSVQAAAVARLAQVGDEKQIPGLLLSGWASHGPALRSQILSALLSRGPWTAALLDAVEQGAVLPGDLDAATRHKDAALKARAEKLLAASGTADRRQVLEAFAAALTLPGDAAAGAVVFKNKCANCHKQEGVGHEVGPNLASLTNKQAGPLLESILDPSRAVESKYMNYIATTDAGLALSGILFEESGSSLTLLAPEGKRQVILRKDLEELRSTGKSLMPDGLEKDLRPQDLANLLKYLGK